MYITRLQRPPELQAWDAVQGLQGYNLFGGGGDGLGLGLDVQQLAAAQVCCACFPRAPRAYRLKLATFHKSLHNTTPTAS